MRISELISIKDPKSPVAEAYRTLRTNIKFSSFDKKVQSIVITSSGTGEGKSTTAANLAIVMAQSGSKTIIIDCDQRRPNVHKLFGISNEVGLSNFIVGSIGLDEVIQKTEVENLHILPSGTRPPNPSELISSNRMMEFVEELKKEYDYIILDSPPVIPVTDAQLLANYADGCLLVVSSGEVEKEAVIKAKDLLNKVNANIIGIVLNKLEVREKGYYGYYYHYYYGEDGRKVKKKCKNRKDTRSQSATV
ncbi:CpsD/CapB family tyrosine-protein kinase [Clostridium sporogenes]|uniref:non-specific protein-tyrosine kinase n=1 Tax=Clostridium cochlearium TaxID=1494 RepID=A0ABY0QMM5_CLOCO|nr:CpsD/CapB family tyrosine-protein kinase [Clostridium cochlearium]SDL28317.1 capsular exopolysaccharide family [Clostridium cochlearium]